MKKYIEEGKAGEVYCGRCGWIRRRGIPGRRGWFTTAAQSGGGPLIDLGVHMIDLSMWMLGNPKPVSVVGGTYFKFSDNTAKSDSEHAAFGEAQEEGVFDVEDLTNGYIRFEGGASLGIEFSWASNIKAENDYVELRGTKAGFRSDRSTRLDIYTEQDGELIDLQPFADADKPASGIGHLRNIHHFVDVCVEGATPVYTPEQGLDMIKLLCAIYESARTGHEVIL